MYRKKDEIQLTWTENRDQVVLAVRHIANRIANEILDELDNQFVAAVNRGELLELAWGKDDIRKLFLKVTQRELGK